MVICRFAPSNTGSLHLGSARTAVYSFAYAKKMGGKVILRIEDTDKQRSTQESLLDILSGLKWLGLEFDDGPSLEDAKRNIYDPKYYQSKQTKIYNKYIDQLLKEGKAFIQDDVVIFRMPKEDVIVHDLILGDVRFPRSENKDFAIRRADGGILFHACVVINDALSGVTHVIRGNDHLANTPKHIALYNALGFKVPEYCHMPLILDDKGAKLSKRRTDQFVLIKDFRANGFLPETIINMLGLLGWSAPDKREVFDLSYMCENFDIKDCGQANARYDPKKLLNFNSVALSKMSFEDFAAKLLTFGKEYYSEILDRFVEKNILVKFVNMWYGRSKTLKEPFVSSDWLLKTPAINKNEDYDKWLVKNNFEGLTALSHIHQELSAINDWEATLIHDTIQEFSKINKLSMNKVCQPIRLALTGTLISPPIDKTLEILGKEESLKRIKSVVATELLVNIGV